MHITSGLSPVSGEFLDYTIHLYGDGVDQCGSTYFAVENEVPESSHTVEIEYVFEQPQLHTLTQANVAADPQLKNKPKEKPWYETFKIESVRSQKRKPIKRVPIDDSETDLTNLTWLQNITNILPMPQFPIEPMSPSLLPPQPVTPQVTRLQRFNKNIAKCQKDFMENKEVYRNNDKKKPPYSYCMLICMALRDNHDKITLAAIYSWIKENFKYYRRADPTWQNSIRHNLSLNKIFVKVARSKEDKGKGGFWKLDLGRLEGTNRMSNRPTHKKKKSPTKTCTNTEESIAVSNIPCNLESEVDKAVLIHLPEIDYGIPSHMAGGNVIVQSAEPPPLVPDEDLANIMMNPTDWGDLELDILDNYLEPW